MVIQVLLYLNYKSIPENKIKGCFNYLKKAVSVFILCCDCSAFLDETISCWWLDLSISLNVKIL